jgi:flagellar biosynthesis regulator FlbT
MLVWDKSLTYSWWVFEEYEQFKLSIKEIIEAYINENIVDNLLSINEWLVKEYTPYNAIDLLQSFVDIGGEIFKDARPRNELESKSIDAFVRSKAKTISLK